VAREDELEQRIVDLELRFMRQEKLVAELDGVILAHERTIERLATEVKALREQVLAGGEALKDERPPHY
jgi:SlyX protein